MKNRDRLARSNNLLAQVRYHFGLTQGQLADLLGVSQVQVAQAEADTRPLPAEAHYRLRMRPLLTALPAVVPPDTAPLRRRLDACRHQVQRITFRLHHEPPDRTAVATNRVSAAATLPAALAAADVDAPLPPRRRENQQLAWGLLRNAALDELEARSGPAPLALLRARLARLQAEAAALGKALTEAGESAGG